MPNNPSHLIQRVNDLKDKLEQELKELQGIVVLLDSGDFDLELQKKRIEHYEASCGVFLAWLKMFNKKREIKKNVEEIKTKKDETIRGWTLQLSELIAFTWPYFLISLLGLKIARIRYFETAGRS